MGKPAFLILLAGSAAGCSGSDVEVLTYGAGQGALGVGDLCIPMDEASPQFQGFNGGVELTIIDPQCSSGACLAHEFQGRVTCPDGNVGPEECFTPAGEQVTVEVRPHALRSRPEDHVYCSCRCGGPRELAPFCECPRGMSCELLVPYSYGQREEPLSGAGSYCVKQ